MFLISFSHVKGTHQYWGVLWDEGYIANAWSCSWVYQCRTCLVFTAERCSLACGPAVCLHSILLQPALLGWIWWLFHECGFFHSNPGLNLAGGPPPFDCVWRTCLDCSRRLVVPHPEIMALDYITSLCWLVFAEEGRAHMLKPGTHGAICQPERYRLLCSVQFSLV